MRTFLLSLAAIVVLVPPAWSQNAPAQDLDAVLRGWEKATADLQSVSAVVERISIDKAFGATDTYKGYMLFTKADKNTDIQARLKLVKANNPNVFEEYVIKGSNIYQYAPANKVIRVFPMPKNQPGAFQQANLLSFLFDMDSKQAKARYEMELDKKNPPDGYDYVYIKPKLAKDKGEFRHARLAIRRADHILAQVWYVEPNGNNSTWNFTSQQLNIKLAPKLFEPEVPPGWRLEKAPAAPMKPAKMP